MEGVADPSHRSDEMKLIREVRWGGLGEYDDR